MTDYRPSMKRTLPLLALAALSCTLLSGCLVRRTVTTGGQTVEDGYAIKRPIKEALEENKGR